MPIRSSEKQMSRQEWTRERSTRQNAGAGRRGEPSDCDAGPTPPKGEREGGLA